MGLEIPPPSPACCGADENTVYLSEAWVCMSHIYTACIIVCPFHSHSYPAPPLPWWRAPPIFRPRRPCARLRRVPRNPQAETQVMSLSGHIKGSLLRHSRSPAGSTLPLAAMGHRLQGGRGGRSAHGCVRGFARPACQLVGGCRKVHPSCAPFTKGTRRRQQHSKGNAQRPPTFAAFVAVSVARTPCVQPNRAYRNLEWSETSCTC